MSFLTVPEFKFTDVDVIQNTARKNGKELQVLIFTGKRDTGKSYTFKQRVIKNFMKNEETFVYVRRGAAETERGKPAKYWRDFNGKKLQNLTDGMYNTVSTYGDTILIGDKKGGKWTYKEELGETVCLKQAADWKSVSFPENCTTMIYEEAITDKVYLQDEPKALFHLISTVFRGRQGCLYMCGNEDTTYFPYMWEWGLGNLEEQPQGTLNITTYSNIDEQGEEFAINIGVYRCRNSEGHINKMVFGKNAVAINSINAAKSYPKLTEKIDDTLYKIRYIDKGFQFLIKLVLVKGNYGLNVVLLDSKFPITNEQRIIYNFEPENADFCPLHSTHFLDCAVERYIVKLLRDKTKIAYDTNTTGDLFNMAIKQTNLLFR